MRVWVQDPHYGGRPVPESVRVRTQQRLLAYAEANYAGRYTRLDVRFRSHFCYVDAYTEPALLPHYPPPDWGETRDEMVARLRDTPTHLCRLRYLGDEERWSFAFYTYSHERYEPTMFPNGDFYGTPEEAFEVSAVYLQ